MRSENNVWLLMKYFKVLLFLAVFIPTLSYSQSQSFILFSREYRLIDSKWYTFFQGKKGDEIIPYRLVVRLKDRGYMENFDFKGINLIGVSLGSERFLDGFYVVLITPDENPFDIASVLETTGKFNVLEFDAYGKRAGAPNDLLFSQ